MNITIEQATSADHSVWDKYVSEHPDATPYHRSAWISAVEQAYQHKSVSLIAYVENKVVGVFPCIHMAVPLGKGKFCALPFCDLGHILADDSGSKEALKKHSLGLLNECKGQYIEYRATQQETEIDGELTGKVRMLLDLPENSEQLMASFKSKLRSQIRKAEKNGLTSSVGNDDKHLDGFYQVFTRNMRDLGSPVHSKKWFECIVSNYQNDAVIANIYKDDIVVGAGIVLINGTKSCIPWASTNSDYNRLAPNMLLYWALLAAVTDKGMTCFDFGRSTVNEGTYKFKKQWGANPSPLLWSTWDRFGNEVIDQNISDKNKSREIVEKVWANLPVGMTTFLGPKVRKYISL